MSAEDGAKHAVHGKAVVSAGDLHLDAPGRTRPRRGARRRRRCSALRREPARQPARPHPHRGGRTRTAARRREPARPRDRGLRGRRRVSIEAAEELVESFTPDPRRAGRARLHRLLPPREPRRGAPPRARAALPRHLQDRCRQRHAPRSPRPARRRGRRRRGGLAAAGPALPPRADGAPDRGAAPSRGIRHSPHLRAARPSRRGASRQLRGHRGEAAHARGDRHAVAHLAHPHDASDAARRGAHGDEHLRPDAVRGRAAGLPHARRRPAARCRRRCARCSPGLHAARHLDRRRPRRQPLRHRRHHPRGRRASPRSTCCSGSSGPRPASAAP